MPAQQANASATLKSLFLSFCLAFVIAVICTYFFLGVAEHLFHAYYREQWGISAHIMHSPPFGTNFIHKLAIVQKWAAIMSFVLSFSLGFVGLRLFFKNASSQKNKNTIDKN